MTDEERLDQIKESYRAFTKTVVHTDLVTYLDEQTENALDRAIKEKDNPLVAISHLQNASGYKTIKAYIERMSEPLE